MPRRSRAAAQRLRPAADFATRSDPARDPGIAGSALRGRAVQWPRTMAWGGAREHAEFIARALRTPPRVRRALSQRSLPQLTIEVLDFESECCTRSRALRGTADALDAVRARGDLRGGTRSVYPRVPGVFRESVAPALCRASRSRICRARRRRAASRRGCFARAAVESVRARRLPSCAPLRARPLRRRLTPVMRTGPAGLAHSILVLTVERSKRKRAESRVGPSGGSRA